MSRAGRRFTAVVVACAAVVIAAAAASQEDIPETTEILGEVPHDLVGRWLAVGVVRLSAGGKPRPVTRIWEIREGAQHLELVLGRSPVPQDVTDRIAKAAEAGTVWEPDDRALRAVAESWGKSPPTGDHVRIESKLATASAFPPEFQNDEIVKGAALALAVVEYFTGTQRVAQTTSIYAVRERTATTLAGTFVVTSLAIAPFPVPITLKGDFRAYRVDAPPRSWLQRLFSGCQRN